MRSLWVVICVAGCSKLPEPDPGCPNRASPIAQTALFEVGVPYHAIIYGNVQPCPGSTASIRAGLVDENNAPVDAGWKLIDEGNLRVELDFTPQSQGPYHFELLFEPNLGRAQGELVRGERRPRATRATFPVPETLTVCRPAHVTSRGTLVCGDDQNRLLAIRGGAVVTELRSTPSGRIGNAFAGDVLWVSDKNGTRRWVDTSTGLNPSPAEGTGDFFAVVLAATETEGFAPVDSRVRRSRVEDGGWLSDEFPVPHRLSFVMGDVIDSLAPSSMTADGGAWWWAADVACLNPIAPDAGQKCFALPSQATWAEPSGVWFAGQAVLGRLDERGETTTILRPEALTTECGPLVSSSRVAQWALAKQDDAGLHWELLSYDGGYLSGWVEGDSIYLLSRGRLDVLER